MCRGVRSECEGAFAGYWTSGAETNTDWFETQGSHRRHHSFMSGAHRARIHPPRWFSHMALPFETASNPRDPRAVRILAKSIYRELRASGLTERDVMELARLLRSTRATPTHSDNRRG